jgi:hypothetical protein
VPKAGGANLLRCVCKNGVGFGQCADIDCNSGVEQDAICQPLCEPFGGIAFTGCSFDDPACAVGGCIPNNCVFPSCGEIDDGCGSTVACGDCPNGDPCVDNQCPPACERTDCPPNSCGTLPDNCGGTLDCGGCGDGMDCQDNACVPSVGGINRLRCTCNNGVTFNHCVDIDCNVGPAHDVICQPECEPFGGIAFTNCEFGDPVCTVGGCNPNSCGFPSCGDIDDGCGSTVACGDCPNGGACTGNQCPIP